MDAIDRPITAAKAQKSAWAVPVDRRLMPKLSTITKAKGANMLRRTKAGPFTLTRAISLDKLDDFAKGHALESVCLPLRAGLDDIPALSLTPDQAGLLQRGQQAIGIAAPNGLVFAMLGESPVALAEVLDGNVRVVRGFNL